MTKRITIPVDNKIDKIKERLKTDTGISMSYVQLINFLVHFYMERANEPRTRWKSLT